MSTLADIRLKVRRLTATPSITQLSDSRIDDYINTFYIYDVPEELKLKSLKTNYIFSLDPNIDTYDFPTETYTSINPPIYCAGYELVYVEDQEQFYSAWPKNNFRETIGVGDGITPNPVLANLTNIPVYRNQVFLSTIIVGGIAVSYLDNGQGSFLEDGVNIIGVSTANPAIVTTSTNHGYVNGDNVFISRVFGTTGINTGPLAVTILTPTTFSVPVDTTGAIYTGDGIVQRQTGTINYITGAIVLNWGTPPNLGENIIAQSVSYRASRPTYVLFFDNKLIFRPVPDIAYRVEAEVFVVPTTLIASTQSPTLRQWWQYLAFGAALKVFEDRGDMEQYGKLFILFDKQQRLVLRRTLQQYKNKRTSNPYSDFGNTHHYNYYGGV